MSELDSSIGSGGSGARRYLTVLFADLTDSTRLGGTMEAEDYVSLIGSVRGLFREIIPRHGGQIARIQGDGVLAVFGLPEAGEDDGRRATEAALELHRAVSNLTSLAGEPLALHSGIHAGLVYLLDGDVERGRFEILGDVPNVAARMSVLAQAGEIVVSEETLGPASHFFAMSEREVVAVKGYGSPLPIRRVLGRAPVRRRFDASALRGSAPFTGRSAESRALASAMRTAATGVPTCVAIAGGPGIGKTRFLEQAMHEAADSGWLILRGYCENYLGAVPMQAFLQVLRTLQGAQDAARPDATRELDARVSAVLREALPQALDAVAPVAHAARAGRAAPVEAMRTLFDGVAARQPVLLVLDDWQWADDASRQILDMLLALQRPILVLIGTREAAGENAIGLATVIELQPMTVDEATRTIEFLLPETDPFLVAEIHRYAGGNPLFIEELCHAARAAGGNRPVDRRHTGTAWLNALIESRVARLPAAQGQLVRTAAVIGNIVPGWLLARITGHHGSDPMVRSLAEHDFVFPSEQPGMLRFKHGITRDVVYGTVGLHERQVLHRRIAAALIAASAAATASDLLELLAYHCEAGGMPVEAAMYAELAGDKAMATFALDRAQTQYAAALNALDALDPCNDAQRVHWCTIAQKLGMACVFDALALTRGVALFERGVALAADVGDAGVLARAEYWLGYVHYSKGNAREAIRHGRAALALCEHSADAGLAAQVRATLGQSLAAAAQYDEALPLLDAAIDSKRARARVGGSVAVGSAYALVCKGAVLGDRGAFAHADECFGEALALLGPTVHQVASSVRNWISAVYLWQGRWDDALVTAEASVHIAEHVKSRQLLAMSRAIWGYARWVISRDPRDLQVVRGATSWVEERKGALLSSLSYGWLADGAVTLGQFTEARYAAARLFVAARAGDPFGEPMACRALARAAAAGRDDRRADHYLERALRSARARGAPHEVAVTQLCRAAVEIDRGRGVAARESLDLASRQFESMAMRWHLAQADDLRRRL